METPKLTLRRADFSLSDEQRLLRNTVRSILEEHCPSEIVRAAEPLGHDKDLWRRIVDAKLVGLGVPAISGGQGAGLVELVLCAEEVGRRLAPAPVIEAWVAARLLASCEANGSDWLSRLVTGEALVTVALHPSHPGRRQLVPAGGIADAVIGERDGQLILARGSEPPVSNHGCAPIGAWDLDAPEEPDQVLVDRPLGGDAATAMVSEWKLLMAAAQIGIAEAALAQAVAYANSRQAFGTPIAAFQGVSHPLVDCHIAVLGGRRLVRKAAWFADHEPHNERHLIPMAFVHAARTAVQTTTVAVHTQGGLGVTMDSDLQLFFRRAKGWANVAGDPSTQVLGIADALYGTR